MPMVQPGARHTLYSNGLRAVHSDCDALVTGSLSPSHYLGSNLQ